jgi:integrase
MSEDSINRRIDDWGLMSFEPIQDNRYFVSSYKNFWHRSHSENELIEESTARQYIRRIKALARKGEASGFLDTENPDPFLLCQGILRQLYTMIADGLLTESSIRNYKAAVMYWITVEAKRELNNQTRMPDDALTEALGQLYQQAQGIRIGTLRKQELVTASLKAKAVDETIFIALENLAFMRPKRDRTYIEAAQVCLRATILLGLRPHEWENARLFSIYPPPKQNNKDKRTLALWVDNAKRTQGRGCGDYRVLELHDIKEDELIAVVSQIRLIQEVAAAGRGSFRDGTSRIQSFYRYVQKTIKAASALYFKQTEDPCCNNITLYSARHECFARLKASNLSNVEIAAYCGHTSTRTQGKSYARAKKTGGKGIQQRFKPSADTVAMVNAHLMNVMPPPATPALKASKDTIKGWDY